jgi:hypothetical protein
MFSAAESKSSFFVGYSLAGPPRRQRRTVVGDGQSFDGHCKI